MAELRYTAAARDKNHKMSDSPDPSDTLVPVDSQLSKHKDQITILISSLALLVSTLSAGISGVAAYSQWFWKSAELHVLLSEPDFSVIRDQGKDGDRVLLYAKMPMSFMNSGNQPILIEEATLNFHNDENLRCTPLGGYHPERWKRFVDNGQQKLPIPIVVKPGETHVEIIDFSGAEGINLGEITTIPRSTTTICLQLKTLSPNENIKEHEFLAFLLAPATMSGAEEGIQERRVFPNGGYVAKSLVITERSKIFIVNRLLFNRSLQSWKR